MDSEKELVAAVAKMGSEMGDLADSLSRLAHRFEENSQGTSGLADLLKENTAAMLEFAKQLSEYSGYVQANTQASLTLAGVIQARGKRWWQ